MAIVSVPRYLYPPPMMPVQPASFSLGVTGIIDAANEKMGYIFRPGKAGNVTHIRWGTRTVTTGATVDVRLETVDSSVQPAIPSGTLFGTNTNGAQVVADGDDNVQFETALTAAAAVGLGDYLAVVIANPAVSFGNMQIADARWSDVNECYALQFTSAWALLAGRYPNIALKYDDGLYYPIRGVWPVSVSSSVTFANSSTPDVNGLRFQVPASVRVCGGWFYADLDGPADLKLIDSDGATILGSRSVLANVRAVNEMTRYEELFTTPVTLLAGTTYRLILEPTSATNIIIRDFDCASVGVMAAMPGGASHYHTSAKDPTGTGSYTDVTTKWPCMGLIVDGVDDGAGSGGGPVAASLRGGFQN